MGYLVGALSEMFRNHLRLPPYGPTAKAGYLGPALAPGSSCFDPDNYNDPAKLQVTWYTMLPLLSLLSAASIISGFSGNLSKAELCEALLLNRALRSHGLTTAWAAMHRMVRLLFTQKETCSVQSLA